MALIVREIKDSMANLVNNGTVHDTAGTYRDPFDEMGRYPAFHSPVMSSTDFESSAFALEQGVQANAKGSPLLLIKSFAGKGRGIVANADMFQGELLLKERPILTLSKGTRDEDATYDPDEKKLKEIIDGLSPRNWACLNALSRVDLPNGHTTLQNKFAINSHAAGKDRNGYLLAGLSLFFSRFNHSCAPNALWEWKPVRKNRCGVIVLHALTNIKKGTEITISYCSEEWPSRSTRSSYFKEAYGFDCKCELCGGAGNTNAREKRLKVLSKLCRQWLDDGDSSKSTNEDEVEDPATGWFESQRDIMRICKLVEEEVNELSSGAKMPYHRVDQRLSRWLHEAGDMFVKAAESYAYADKPDHGKAIKHYNEATEIWAYACLVDRVCFGEDPEELLTARTKMTQCSLLPRQLPVLIKSDLHKGSKRIADVAENVLQWRPGAKDLSYFDAITRRVSAANPHQDSDVDMDADGPMIETSDSVSDDGARVDKVKDASWRSRPKKGKQVKQDAAEPSRKKRKR